MRKLFYALFFCCLFVKAYSREIRVNVLSDYHPDKIQINIQKGTYNLQLSDTQRLFTLTKDDVLSVKKIGLKVAVVKNGVLFGTYERLFLQSSDSTSYFRLSCLAPKVKNIVYEDDLEISANATEILLINKVDLNNYVAGVIEGEIGNVKSVELLKVQAVISRTYVLKHIDRHKTEGFEVCDKVHCQVFHGRSRFNLMIKPAVDSTGNLVIVDQNNDLIESVFHANCGGQTINSEDLWQKARPYLRSVQDTFCIRAKQATWEKEINKTEWLNYLSKKSGKKVTDPCVVPVDNRLVTMPCCTVPYKDLRTDFKLRSTFFVVEEKPEKVLLKGRGYGHGVGMCQEGAIEMSREGLCYDDIIHFYYKNVSIIDAEKLTRTN